MVEGVSDVFIQIRLCFVRLIVLQSVQLPILSGNAYDSNGDGSFGF